MRIRAVAIAVIRRGPDLLVFRFQDSVRGLSLHRPLGGGIEFGERGEVAVRRELREELGVELENVRWLGFLDNVFTFEGRAHHEHVLVFEADVPDEPRFRGATVEGANDNGNPIDARWVAVSAFASGEARLVPEGLLALVTGTATENR